jgi:hypothetical protein
VDSAAQDGRKDDGGKLQMRLLPWAALRAVADVMTWAVAEKKNPYPVGNWKFVKPERYEDALIRHWSAWIEGEHVDPESGRSHLAHVCCCALFLLWFEVTGRRGRYIVDNALPQSASKLTDVDAPGLPDGYSIHTEEGNGWKAWVWKLTRDGEVVVLRRGCKSKQDAMIAVVEHASSEVPP